ncbi:hypothetical protein Lal_00038357 [Lupinus albus]|nr:hypothetical protein Lal_00038357 [Lupinus albus]
MRIVIKERKKEKYEDAVVGEDEKYLVVNELQNLGVVAGDDRLEQDREFSQTIFLSHSLTHSYLMFH